MCMWAVFVFFVAELQKRKTNKMTSGQQQATFYSLGPFSRAISRASRIFLRQRVQALPRPYSASST